MWAVNSLHAADIFKKMGIPVRIMMRHVPTVAPTGSLINLPAGKGISARMSGISL